MAIIEKTYTQSPEVLWNVINDIVEMRKGKVCRYDGNSIAVSTEMYGIKTEYVFRVVCTDDQTSVSIETGCKIDDEMMQVELMFTTLEKMLQPFAQERN